MKLTERTSESLICLIGYCPAVFETDRDTYIVIGRQLTDQEVNEHLKGRVGNNETVIEIPKQLLTNIHSNKS